MALNTEQKLEFPYEFYELEPELEAQLMRDFSGVKSGFVQVGPEKWLHSKAYKTEANKIYNFDVRPTDVFLTGIPRSGTTLTAELVWLIANNLNFEAASETTLDQRFPCLELDVIRETSVGEEKHISVSVLNKLEGVSKRRFIKSHLSFSLLPPDLLQKGCKVIYVARNPLDVAVSRYHFARLFRHVDFVESFSKYWGYFRNNLTTFTPYWSHIKEGWERRHEANVLFLFYEGTVSDWKATIRKVANFLEVTLNDEQVCQLENHFKFERFKKNKSVNHENKFEMNWFKEGEGSFIRRGKVGGWRDYFDAEEAKKAEEWLKENQKAIGIEFKF